MTVTVTVPAQKNWLDLQIENGDTVQFVEKFNAQQALLQELGGELNGMSVSLGQFADEMTALRDQAQAIVGFDGDYNGLSNLPDLTIFVPHTAGLLTDYREKTSTDLTNPVLDFAAGNVAVRALTSPVDFALANVPAAGSAKLELLLTANGHAVDFTGIANLVWELSGQAPTLNTIDRVVFSKYDGDTSIYAAHSRVV